MEILKKLLSLFKQDKIYNFGVLEDNRPQEEKDKDYSIDEVYISSVDPYVNKKITESELADENQFGTSSCVAHSVSTATESVDEPRPSHLLFYRERSIYPQQGCMPWEMVDMASNYKLPLWEVSPTPYGATEQYANSLPKLTLEKRDKPLPYFACRTAYDVAVASNNGHAVTITIYANVREWEKEYVDIIYPELKLRDKLANIAHQITVLANSSFIDENGIKRVAVADSSHFGGRKIRYPSEDFLNARMYNPGYFYTKPLELPKPTYKYPKYNFKKQINYGQWSDDVRMLQKFFIVKGYLAKGLDTGYFGNLTLKALCKFRLDTFGKEYADRKFVGRDTLKVINSYTNK